MNSQSISQSKKLFFSLLMVFSIWSSNAAAVSGAVEITGSSGGFFNYTWSFSNNNTGGFIKLKDGNSASTVNHTYASFGVASSGSAVNIPRLRWYRGKTAPNSSSSGVTFHLFFIGVGACGNGAGN